MSPRLKDPIMLLATWFGAGLSPKMPGTAGTFAAMPFALPIHLFYGSEGLLVASLLLFFIGVAISQRYMERYERHSDPQEIVIDEAAGVWFTLAFVPIDFLWYGLAFVAFRFFDIIKPWPVSLADRQVPGGLGVMLDDLLAAGYAALLLTGVQWVL